METGAIRPYATIAHDPPARRDDLAGSRVATDLPTEKTVRAAQSASDGRNADDAARHRDHPAVKTGFERDPSGSIVYRWTDQTTERVILEIPRSDKIRSRQSYGETTAATAATADKAHTFDRSV